MGGGKLWGTGENDAKVRLRHEMNQKSLPVPAGLDADVLALIFQQLVFDALALEDGQVVNEQLAFQMINLMLQTHRQQSIGFQYEGLAVAVQGLDPDAAW